MPDPYDAAPANACQPSAATTRERLEALRSAMGVSGWEAVLVPTGDPHGSEYPPQHWCSRAWLSGFSGSAGTLVVLPGEAALWTDGRYYIQAAQQLEGSGIGLQRGAERDCPKIEDWLGERLGKGSTVVCDGRQMSAAAAEKIRKALEERGIVLKLDGDPLEAIWADRPPLPAAPAIVHELRFTGLTVREKLELVRADMTRSKATQYLLSSLDGVAWLLNLRGSDTPWTPLVLGLVLVGPAEATCFIDAAKCPPAVLDHLSEAGVARRDYAAAGAAVGALDAGSVLLLDPKKTCASLRERVPAACRVVEADDPTLKRKGVKSEVELTHMREATTRDCAVVAECLAWVEASLRRGEAITERAVSARLEALRAGQEHCLGSSFETIAAYGDHAAQMHYAPTPSSDAVLAARGFFLLDTGGQYLDGTTDMTRTVACGPLEERQRREYTLVLKAHIAICRAVFPYGTTGPHLDILARGVLAREGLNYRCGTGHGVGFCLGVHEGPHGISQSANAVTLEPGMLLTCEPGVYREGEYGIRIENTLLVRDHATTDQGRFLAFEMLSHCPIDLRPVLPALLTREERDWLARYHADTRERLAGRLGPTARAWLRRACATRRRRPTP